MQTKSAARIQADIVLMRHAYRHRSESLNHPRSRFLPEPRPSFVIGYATAVFILLGIVAIIFTATH